MGKPASETESGFTLMELLIVVAVIGILAAVGMPFYQGYMTRAKINASIENHARVKTFAASTLALCNAGSGVVTIPGLSRLTCNQTTATEWGQQFTNYFARVVEAKNPYKSSEEATYPSNSAPPLGRTNIYGAGNTITIRTQPGNEGGGSAPELVDVILIE